MVTSATRPKQQLFGALTCQSASPRYWLLGQHKVFTVSLQCKTSYSVHSKLVHKKTYFFKTSYKQVRFNFFIQSLNIVQCSSWIQYIFSLSFAFLLIGVLDCGARSRLCGDRWASQLHKDINKRSQHDHSSCKQQHDSEAPPPIVDRTVHDLYPHDDVIVRCRPIVTCRTAPVCRSFQEDRKRTWILTSFINGRRLCKSCLRSRRRARYSQRIYSLLQDAQMWV